MAPHGTRYACTFLVTTTVASGAADLAHRIGASLLPVVTARHGDHFVVTIEPEIEIDRAAKRRVSSERAVAEYANRLEPVVLRHSEQWLGWFAPD